uniref:Uncharacterized protein n=1 Tax=Panagrolaimus sp. ES5 TaxID=591445 RepID=A0AC34FM18_9BILA
MIHEDGTVVMLEEIIDVIPNVVEFYYTFGDDSSMINDATFANIRKLKRLRHCAWFSLYNVPEVINVADLAAFAKGRKKYPEYFYIEFSGNNNLSAVYRYQLNALHECLYADAIAEYKSEKFWEYVKFGFETLIYPFFIR